MIWWNVSMNAPPDIEGLYVHVPFCDGKCAYCAFYSTLYTPELGDGWLRAVEVEVRQLRSEFGGLRPATVYFGGGTPSLLTEGQLGRLIGLLSDQLMAPDWNPGPGVEWSVEANPGSLTEGKLGLLRRAGVNRISLGVQSLHDDVLVLLGRRHRVADALAAVRAIRGAGFENWGMDLIACIPGVSEARWQETLVQAVNLAPTHISVYALTSEEGAQLTERLRRGDMALLDDERQLDMLALAEATLAEAGYGRYEISNYAKPGFECRHHLSCWRGGNYLGVGCAAASRVGSRRWTNRPDLEGYGRAAGLGEMPERDLDELTPDVDAIERLVFGLRMAEGVEPGGIIKSTGGGTVLLGMWRTRLGQLAAEGLVTEAAGVWRLTRRGREMADHVAVELMP
jgi:oxygen-independent coproporphyrinogen-3 oxidase